jgi:recombination associated protein RdgC
VFKNAIVYRLAGPSTIDLFSLEQALARSAFVPCGPSQPVSVGWVPPRAPGGLLAEVVGSQVVLKLMTESKVLPAEAVKRKVEDACKQIEQSTGRKPGKKQTKEIKEEVLLTLMPAALTRQASLAVWIDPTRSLLVVDASSMTRADDAVMMLIKSIDGLAVTALSTESLPAPCMAAWLLDGEPPANFTVDRELELKSADEMKSVVRYGRHALDIEEVRNHINAGKVPTCLALTWKGRTSFVLTDTGTLRKIVFLDGVFDGKRPEGVDAFDADVTISTGELQLLISDLIDAQGGERPAEALTEGSEGAAPAAPAPHAGDGPDPMLDQARAIVIQHRRASISLVQRHLRLGYNRAARLLEALEAEGVVSAMHTNGSRDLLVAA